MAQQLKSSAGHRDAIRLPSPRVLLAACALAMVLLGGTVVGAAFYAVYIIDKASIAAETDRATVALAVALSDAEISTATSERIGHDFSLTDARFVAPAGVAAMEVSVGVPRRPDLVLAWTPRRFGSEMFYVLAPLRLLASALFLTGVALILYRLYRMARELDAQRKAAQELAARDPLTGLANRLAFDQQLEQAIGGGCAILYLDLDGFKQVNDRLGHSAGDDLLRTVAERLNGLALLQDLVARIGGDEFVLLRRAPLSRDELGELAADIGTALAAPVRLGTTEISIVASIGIAMAPPDANDADGLVRAADAALYRAKALPGHAFVFADTLRLADAA